MMAPNKNYQSLKSYGRAAGGSVLRDKSSIAYLESTSPTSKPHQRGGSFVVKNEDRTLFKNASSIQAFRMDEEDQDVMSNESREPTAIDNNEESLELLRLKKKSSGFSNYLTLPQHILINLKKVQATLSRAG